MIENNNLSNNNSSQFSRRGFMKSASSLWAVGAAVGGTSLLTQPARGQENAEWF